MRPKGKQMFKRMVSPMMMLELTITGTGVPKKKTIKCSQASRTSLVFRESHMATATIAIWKRKNIVKFTQ